MTALNPSYEFISALADSQLTGELLDEVLRELAVDEKAMASWRDVHLIGDALRAPAWLADSASFLRSDCAFLDRFNHRLAESQLADAGGSVRTSEHSTPPQLGAVGSANPSANDSWFGWKLAAGFASVAAVSAMVWTTLAGQGAETSIQLAEQSSPAQILVASPQGIIVRDARLNELLAAHKQFGTGSALQASSGFLQSAAFEVTPASER